MMDTEQRARLQGCLLREMPYGSTTVLCGDLRALLAAYDAAMELVGYIVRQMMEPDE